MLVNIVLEIQIQASSFFMSSRLVHSNIHTSRQLLEVLVPLNCLTKLFKANSNRRDGKTISLKTIAYLHTYVPSWSRMGSPD